MTVDGEGQRVKGGAEGEGKGDREEVEWKVRERDGVEGEGVNTA